MAVFIEKTDDIGAKTKVVFEMISSDWPSNPLEIAKKIGDRGSQKSLSAKYLYHFKKLSSIGLIELKKIGNTYVAWPREMEKLRVIHEMLTEE